MSTLRVLRGAAEVYVGLRERDFDLVLLQGLVDISEQIVTGAAARFRVIDPCH